MRYRLSKDTDDPVAVDINGDGWLDIMVRNQTSTQLLPVLNNGDGTFHEISSVSLPRYPGSFAMEISTTTARSMLASSYATAPMGVVPRRTQLATCTPFLLETNDYPPYS